jgi:hypothetical protein
LKNSPTFHNAQARCGYPVSIILCWLQQAVLDAPLDYRRVS